MPETCTVKMQERRPTLQPGSDPKQAFMVLRGRSNERKDVVPPQPFKHQEGQVDRIAQKAAHFEK